MTRKSNNGLAATSRKGKATRKTPTTQSSRAGLIFPVGRTLRKLKQGRYAEKCGPGAAVFLAAVLEYLTCEVLELAGECAHEKKKKTIMPRHIQLAIRSDDELTKVLAETTITEGGVNSNIHPFLWPEKQPKGKKGKRAENTHGGT